MSVTNGTAAVALEEILSDVDVGSIKPATKPAAEPKLDLAEAIKQANAILSKVRSGARFKEDGTLVLTDDGCDYNFSNLMVHFTRDSDLHAPWEGSPMLIASVRNSWKTRLPSHMKTLEAKLEAAITAIASVSDALRRESRLFEGMTTFNGLTFMFSEGDEVVVRNHVAGRVHRTRRRDSFFGAYIEIEVRSFQMVAGKCEEIERDVRIPYFEGLMEADRLPIRLMTDKDKAIFEERGKKILSMVEKPSYVRCTGNISRRSWFGTNHFKANGRCMIDAASFRRFETNYRGDHVEAIHDEMAPENVKFLLPTLYGFSFATKFWGEFDIEDLEEIVFRSDAIDQLVLDKDLKDMVVSLVSYGADGFADVVDAKGGGCIFLLHGEPGVGKTLTAEATAEHLRRPLYSVSIGELGTDVDSLEERLREILEMASSWNAVVLLDEADIFMEKRDQENIHRNAMVGVFLRLLEYHQGVMFLTTNRVGEFDPAFYSRISVAIKYSSLTDQARFKVWNNLLTAAGIAANLSDIEALCAQYPRVNGRQIKNAIRSGMALAKAEGVPMEMRHLSKPLDMAEKFMTDLSQ